MIYDNVKRIADTQKVPLREVEKRAGLSSGVISKWKNVSPTVNSLQAVAKVLGTTVDKLLK